MHRDGGSLNPVISGRLPRPWRSADLAPGSSSAGASTASSSAPTCDVDRRRVARETASGTRKFIHDGQNFLEKHHEFNSSRIG
jgi:hypothetical protein